MSDLKSTVKNTIDEAAASAKKAVGVVIDKSRGMAHDAGGKLQEAGKRLKKA